MIAILGSNGSFNDRLYLRESHNCYSYLLNLKSPEAEQLCEKEYKHQNYCKRSQPGYAAGYEPIHKKDLRCPEVMKRTLADNPSIRASTFYDTCKPDEYKGALVVDPGNDYHYYRQNDDGYWSHKPGYKPSTVYDASGKLITNPKTANRNYGRLNYKDFCGYFCVPRQPTRKRMYYRSISKLATHSATKPATNARPKKTRKRQA